VLTEGETVEIDPGLFRIERMDKGESSRRFTPRQIDSTLVLAPILASAGSEPERSRRLIKENRAGFVLGTKPARMIAAK
jgi:hypothetical protein